MPKKKSKKKSVGHMKIEMVSDRVFHVSFKTQREMAETFLRFQEHYESPKFKGQVFTLGQFKEWYRKERGRFTYYSDWGGFNIPSYVLEPFQMGLFDPLSRAERLFVDAFKKFRRPYYIIGTAEKIGTATFNHELAHAYYALNKSYRARVKKILRDTCKGVGKIGKVLKKHGYCDDVLTDEVHAYLMFDTGLLTMWGLDVGKYRKTKKLLMENFKKINGE